MENKKRGGWLAKSLVDELLNSRGERYMLANHEKPGGGVRERKGKGVPSDFCYKKVGSSRDERKNGVVWKSKKEEAVSDCASRVIVYLRGETSIGAGAYWSKVKREKKVKTHPSNSIWGKRLPGGAARPQEKKKRVGILSERHNS